MLISILAAGMLSAPPGEHVALRNGVQMPLIACGTGGDSDTTAEETVKAALAVGFSSIDTAHDYADLAGVAAGIASVPRDAIFLTTKIPGCGETVDHPLLPPCFANTLAMAKADIALLGPKNQVDLLLIHFPPLLGCGEKGCAKIQQQWAALEQLYAANLTRAIGVSNFCETCLKCVAANATVLPMVNQVQYHVGMGKDPAGLMTYCASHDIVVEAYSPLAGGRLLKNFPLGVELAPKYNWSSAAQVGLGYIAQRRMPLVTKSSNPTYLAEDLDLFGPKHPTMSDSDFGQLDAIQQPSCSMEAPGGCCHA